MKQIYFRWTNIYLGERQICTYDTHKCMKCPIKEQGTLVCEYWWQIIDQSSVGHDQQPALTTFSQTRQHLSLAGGETNMINISPYKKCLGRLAQRCAKQDPWTPPMRRVATQKPSHSSPLQLTPLAAGTWWDTNDHEVWESFGNWNLGKEEDEVVRHLGQSLGILVRFPNCHEARSKWVGEPD